MTILAFDHPILDVITDATVADVEAFGLEPCTQRLSCDDDEVMFQKLLMGNSKQFIAGGCGMNSLRGAQWWLRKHGLTSVECRIGGAVGNDEALHILEAECEAAGVTTAFKIVEEGHTAKCACFLIQKQRTMVTDLGSAPLYCLEDHQEEFMDPNVKILFLTAFFINGNPEGARCLCKHLRACPQNRRTILMVGLSAAWAAKCDAVIATICGCADVVFGNELECKSLAGALGIDISDKMETVCGNIVMKFRVLGSWLICTQGPDPVICATNIPRVDRVFSHTVRELPDLNIKDDVGAGDGFVGGFMGYIYSCLSNLWSVCGRPGSPLSPRSLDSLSTQTSKSQLVGLSMRRVQGGVEEGIYAARQVLKRSGCQY